MFPHLIKSLIFHGLLTSPCPQLDATSQARVLSKAGLVLSSQPLSRGEIDEVIRRGTTGGDYKDFRGFLVGFQRHAASLLGFDANEAPARVRIVLTLRPYSIYTLTLMLTLLPPSR